MKKTALRIFTFVILCSGTFAVSSCKKCANCTYSDAVNGKDTSDFCGRGNSYTDQLHQHEKNGWKCVEE